MTFFWPFHYIFVYYPSVIQHFIVFNCQFSVASLTNINKQISFLTLPKKVLVRKSLIPSKYTLQKVFFSFQKRCRYARVTICPGFPGFVPVLCGVSRRLVQKSKIFPVFDIKKEAQIVS